MNSLVTFEGLVRNPDAETSELAASCIEKKRTALQSVVLEFVRERGEIIDSDLVALAFQRGLAESTLRKRRTELTQQGVLQAVGRRNNARGRSEQLWAIKRPTGEMLQQALPGYEIAS